MTPVPHLSYYIYVTYNRCDARLKRNLHSRTGSTHALPRLRITTTCVSDAGTGQPFTAPLESPSMNSRWSIRNRPMTGTMEISVPAMSMP